MGQGEGETVVSEMAAQNMFVTMLSSKPSRAFKDNILAASVNRLKKPTKQTKPQNQSASFHQSKHDKRRAQAAKVGLPVISGVF